MAIEVANKLTELRPADSPYFAQRLQTFKVRMNDANKRWLAQMAPYRGAKVVTYHPSWPNFAKHFGLQIAGTVEPKPGIPPSPSHTLEIINLIKDQKIKAILMEPYFDRKTPDFIAEKTGSNVVVMYPSVGGKAGLDDYFKLFDYDLGELIKALR
jgi:zinc/manganese transport system substrate-binding protein